MKVDAPEPPSESTTAKQAPDGARFKKALQQADSRRTPPGGPPLSAPPTTARPGAPAVRAPALPVARAGPVVAQARAALASPENLGRTRQAMHAEVQRLGTVRGEAGTQVQARTEQRVTDLIARELARDLKASPPPTQEARPPPGMPNQEPGRQGAEAQAPESRVAAPAAAGGAGAGASGVEATAPASRAEAALELIERIEVFVKSQRPALSLNLRGGLDATVEVERTGPREVALRIQGRHGPLPAEDVARLREGLEARGLRLRSLRVE
ncbi:hypothetical protein HPC49_45635 [Pyxidicoccus fallax]|uniref:Uncharacterized protein n=1 Tax=Pyxidicoccus fallax TaxID=394095 RepID=A0A848LTZ3_9BACT|nr:hypothetical protein [Pyxidicoccus fallax]NMO21415.1 hypothetical protein [Pyxidicoccus fallax]NPC85464.1 hypothetical protein [Pyxidicoccus fallax]